MKAGVGRCMMIRRKLGRDGSTRMEAWRQMRQAAWHLQRAIAVGMMSPLSGTKEARDRATLEAAAAMLSDEEGEGDPRRGFCVTTENVR